MFKGQILFLAKDQFNAVHLYKKKSRDSAMLHTYIEYIQHMQKELGERLVKAYVVNLETRKYMWCSNVWRTDLNEKPSFHHQKYLDYLSTKREDVRFIGSYKAMRTKGLHVCWRGHEWETQPIKVKNGEKCPRCKNKNKESNGAKYITDLLIESGVEFRKEVSLKRFGYDRDLRLDFVVYQNNYPLFAIEYNGIQHYRRMRSAYFGGYKRSWESKQRDRLKRRHCWKIGLPVIDIPYSETNSQIKETVMYFLSLFDIVPT